MMVTELNYFGTNIDDYGHYFWVVGEYGLKNKDLSFPVGKGIPVSRYKEWPFNPEEYPKNRAKGAVEFYQESGYSILAICGSCKDNRPGTKSVFFKEGAISKEELKEEILSYEVVRKMIEKMPFKINW